METESVKSELVVAKPAEMMRLASDVAGVCEKIVKNTAVRIKGKQYVKVEGWQSIATAHGCVAGIQNVERTDTGFRAVAELRRIDNGIMIATAEGFVGDDEKTWQSRDEYARRAMAQTRAISRVCRSAFAHVVVLIDAELSTTPAEEVPFGGFENHREESGGFKDTRGETNVHGGGMGGSKVLAEVRKEMATAQANAAPKRFNDWRDCIMHFSKHAGKQLGELSNQQLSWYYEVWMPKKQADKQYPITQKDQNLFDALEGWHMEVEKKRLAFEARRQAAEASVASDEIPMDWPEEGNPS